MSDNHPERFLIQLSVGFAAITVAITLVFFAWWSMKEQFMFGDQPFDAVGWMQARHSKQCERGDMVHDIRRNFLVAGMPRSVVTTRLGRPDWEEAAQLEYELGTCLWVVHGLRLYFDPQGLLVHHAIVQH
ncbi:MAG: hypothetical protein FGM62_06600 [Methylobacterium sp.]|nr:hypothetical protein [Methylobacterium sp.]